MSAVPSVHPADPAAGYRIARSTMLLAGCMAINSAALQLSVALATTTFALVTGLDSLLGLGPALFLSAAAASAPIAGRAMDRIGRVPVLVGGFALGACGNALTAVGALDESSAGVVGGLILVGAGNGVVQLTRTAGGDLYPPERRARGISYVLFGAVFGAILGPALFVPLFADRDLTSNALAVPWFAAAGVMVVGACVALAIRPDPRRVADAYAALARGSEEVAEDRPAPLRELLRRPRVAPAMLAALASYSVMVAVMNLTGHMVTDDRGHDPDAVFPIIAAHIVGMFGLVLVVGDLIDRIGRRTALMGGLALIGASVISLAWVGSVAVIAFALFALGLGWAFSFVAASAELVDSARPCERGRLIGFNDLCASALAASFALGGGYLLSELGPGALAAAGTVVAIVPMLYIAGRVRSSRAAGAFGTLRGR
jgi:MFS family permease